LPLSLSGGFVSLDVPIAEDHQPPKAQPDAFISYSHKDSAWVREYLVPALRARDLSVLTDEDFEVGGVAVKSMADAVATSRFTVAVLTPAYVSSDWAMYEVQLSQTLGPADKVLPLLREHCAIPLQLRHLTWADFTLSADRWDEQLKRLVARMTGLQHVPPLSGARVQHGLEAFIEILSQPAAQGPTGDFMTSFADASERITAVAAQKALHDSLHGLEQFCSTHLEQVAQKAGTPQWRKSVLETCEDHLRQGRVELTKIGASGQLPELIGRVGRDLERLILALHDAAASPDTRSCKRVHTWFEHFLSTHPPSVNRDLVREVAALRLNTLASTLSSLAERLRNTLGNSTALDQFERSVEVLATLQWNLAALVKRHDTWQHVHDAFRLLESEARGGTPIGFPDPSDLNVVVEGTVSEWRREFHQRLTDYADAVVTGNGREAEKRLRPLRRLAFSEFQGVDSSLKQLCDELRMVATPLRTIIRMAGTS
jgi:hypothetical protein